MKVYLDKLEEDYQNKELNIHIFPSVASHLLFNKFNKLHVEHLTTGPGWLWHKYDGYDISREEPDLVCFNITEIYRTDPSEWGELTEQIVKFIESDVKKIIFMNSEHTTNNTWDYAPNDSLLRLDELVYEKVGDTDRVLFIINNIDDIPLKCNYIKFSPYLFNWNIKQKYVPNNLIGSIYEHLHANKRKHFLSYNNHGSDRQDELLSFVNNHHIKNDVYISYLKKGIYLDFTNEEFELATPWQFNFQNKHHYLDSYFSVVRETDNHAITEKTFKPMINFHPFIYNLEEERNKMYIDTLEKMGFKTFDKYFQGNNRFERIEYFLSIQDKNKWFEELTNTLVYNHHRILNFKMGDIL